MTEPKVSIGLPVYNAQRYLRETLDLLLAQTYSDFELIISNNASNDETQSICHEYAQKDARIQLHHQPHNLGAALNFNFVFESSVGEYFRWNAYDDPVAPKYLESTIAVLERYPDVIMSYPKTILLDDDGEVLEHHDDMFHLDLSSPSVRFSQFFNVSAWCHPVFGLIRRAVLQKTGLIGAYASSDRVLLGELALRGKCWEVPEHLAYRRLHAKISTRVNTSDEAMAAWFDPDTSHRIALPRVRRIVELARAIQRTPMKAQEKTDCYFALARFYMQPERRKGAIKDVKRLRQVLRQSIKPSEDIK